MTYLIHEKLTLNILGEVNCTVCECEVGTKENPALGKSCLAEATQLARHRRQEFLGDCSKDPGLLEDFNSGMGKTALIFTMEKEVYIMHTYSNNEVSTRRLVSRTCWIGTIT